MLGARAQASQLLGVCLWRMYPLHTLASAHVRFEQFLCGSGAYNMPLNMINGGFERVY